MIPTIRTSRITGYMMTLNNIPISKKLPIAFAILSFAVALQVSWMGYRDFRSSLISQSQTVLNVLTTERANAVENWFDTLNSQMLTFATTPTVAQAMHGFSSTFGLLMDDHVTDLQNAYIRDNPNPHGNKDLLDRADGPLPYNFQHADYHPVFRDMKDRFGLYDLFLFDLAGNMVYSVYKESDFATNFESGPFRDSGLGDAFRAARNGQSGQTYFVDFRAYTPSDGAAASFVASPIADADGQMIGVIAIQLPTDILDGIVTNPEGLGETGEMTLVGRDGKARTNSRLPDGHDILDPVQPNTAVLSAFDEGLRTYLNEPTLNGTDGVGIAKVLNILGVDWLIVGEFASSEVYGAAYTQRNKTLIFAMVAMIIAAICGWVVSRAFTRPLDQLVAAMSRVSQRDYNAELPDVTRHDEVGALSRAVTLVVDRLREFDVKLELEKKQADSQKFAVAELASGLKRLADGDFSVALNRTFAAEYDELRLNYNETVHRLGETIADLKSFSALLQRQSETIGRDSNELSQVTENQASTLEETAAALDQITETIKQNGNDLRSAETLIIEADGHVKQGRSVVENTTEAMDEIERSSEEISSIIRVVDDIAFQTNLLALNAGVEAARAGDAGRGFAVVAAEVRQLAMRSADAVAQIKALINTSSANVGTGVKLVRQTESVLMEIVQRMEGISTVITSVATGAAEQSINIGEINTGVNNLDRVTQQNAMMVENSNASVQALNSEAAKLSNMLAGFKVRQDAHKVVPLDKAAFASVRHA